MEQTIKKVFADAVSKSKTDSSYDLRRIGVRIDYHTVSKITEALGSDAAKYTIDAEGSSRPRSIEEIKKSEIRCPIEVQELDRNVAYLARSDKEKTTVVQFMQQLTDIGVSKFGNLDKLVLNIRKDGDVVYQLELDEAELNEGSFKFRVSPFIRLGASTKQLDKVFGKGIETKADEFFGESRK